MSTSYRRSTNAGALKSIDLMATAHRDDRYVEEGDDDGFVEDDNTDDDEDDDVDRKERDLFENAGRKERSLLSTWKDAGIKKDKVLQSLISKFSMLVHKNSSSEIDTVLEKQYNTTRDEFYADEVPVDALFSKLPSTTKALIKIIE